MEDGALDWWGKLIGGSGQTRWRVTTYRRSFSGRSRVLMDREAGVYVSISSKDDQLIKIHTHRWTGNQRSHKDCRCFVSLF